MKTSPSNSIDYESWVRRVNERWIVHSGLEGSLGDYLDHLARTDAQRLARSCELAHRFVHQLPPGEDPKPWFYGASFSLADEAEAKQFLKNYPLLAAIVPALQGEQHLPETLQSVGESTIRKIRRLREALADHSSR